MGCETTQVLATLVYFLTCIVYAMFAYWWNLLLSDLEILTFLINIFYTNFEARFLVCGWVVVFFNTKTTIFPRTVKTMFWCLCWILCWYFVPARRTVICFCWSFCTRVTLVLFDFDLMFFVCLGFLHQIFCLSLLFPSFFPYTPPNKSTQYWICLFDDN